MVISVASASSIGFPNGSVGSTEQARRARAGDKREAREGYDGNELTRISPKKVIEATGDEANKARTVVNCLPERSLLAMQALHLMKSLFADYS